MAPEQLEGKEADARTDIFAFGAVLYEMATGARAFEGESHASLIAAILKQDPPAFAARELVAPPALERVVRKCLAKSADVRWQSARDLADALKWIAEERQSSTQRSGEAPAWVRRAVEAVAMGCGHQCGRGARCGGCVEPAARRSSSGADSAVRRSTCGRCAAEFADADLQPVARRARAGVHRRKRPRSLVVSAVTRSTRGAADSRVPKAPWISAFSPDGQWLAFSDNGALKKSR